MMDLSPAAGDAWLLGLSVAVFVPLKYIYPSKMKVLRNSTCIGGLVWSIVVAWTIRYPEFATQYHIVEITLSYPAYYIALSAWLGKWHQGPYRQQESVSPKD
jgi:phosphatidylcholine synthase